MLDVVVRSFQSPGDLVMLTAAVRDLHLAHPGRFRTDVHSSAPSLWDGNPWLTRLSESDRGVRVIDMHYPLIHESNQRPLHFIHGYAQYLAQQLNVSIPVTRFHGEVFLTDEERRSPSDEFELPEGYWIIIAGGKYDFTAKWWNPASYQAVVDHYRGTIPFVQCGEGGHWHLPLEGATNLVGKTTLRQFIRLMHHAAGVVCPVTFAMHLSPAVETPAGRPKVRPCVVIAGGREPPHWEAYPQHQYISTVGALTCCETGGCWKSRCQPVGDGDDKDRRNLCEQPVQITSDLRIPRCMEMISPEDVIRRIEIYRQGGVLTEHKVQRGLRPGLLSASVGTNGHVPSVGTPAATNGIAHDASNGKPAVTPKPAAATRPISPGQRRPLPATVPRRRGAVALATPKRASTAIAPKPAVPPPRREPVAQVQPISPRQETAQRRAPVTHAEPMPPRQQAAKRVEFRHGLGDGVQLTIVLRHLAFYHPEWEIDLAALKGKETVGRGLTRRQLILGEASGVTYEKVWSLDWDECREAYSQWPSTKPTRCLREVFGLEPRLELFGYQIERSPAADARAQAYLAEVCARSASPAQIASPRVTHVSTPTSRAAGAAVLIHYQGNTSGERKDLTHEVARRVCDTVRELGYVPVILDWDRRSPLVDQKTVFNPGADHPLWGGAGTGDAEILAALIEASALMIGIDSGPLHVAGATSTPTIGVWTKHHPVHYFDLCPNVRHLVPTNHRSLANGPAAVEFFEGHYEHRVYRDLAASLVAEVRHVLTGEPLAEEPEEKPTGSPVKILKSTQYDQQYYEEHCRTGLDYLNFGDWQRQYGKWFVESLGFHKRRVVDVGCACGAILRGLGDAGAIVAGFDLSEHMIGLGREKWPDMKSLLHVANAKSLPFYGSSSWDGIHCGQVAEHWPPEDVPQILKELNRVTAPGGLFFCTLDTQELFDRQRRSVETDDPTHLCIRPRAWWTEQLAATGWTDCTAEYEPQLRNHPNSFLKKYDWDFFVARKEPRSLPAAPYDLGRYPEIWRWSGASVDRRHLFWMYDILQGCRFEHALEIGCLNGASSTAFVEAINRGYLGRATLCDIELRPSLQQVVSQCTEPERVRTYQGRSVDLLRSQAGFDVIWVDGDHRLENVRAEVDLLLAQRPVCVMAHDTNAQAVTYPDCDGPPYLKWAFQTAAGYQCLEDNTVRPGEDTGRGMFLATTSSTVFDVAREALRKWGAPMPDIE